MAARVARVVLRRDLPCSCDRRPQNNGIFEFRVKNAAGKEASWTIDLKKTGTVKKGEAKSLGLKPDVTIILSDETFVEIADGKTTGQKAFMTGALKTKGNMMLATKLDGVLKVRKTPSSVSSLFSFALLPPSIVVVAR